MLTTTRRVLLRTLLTGAAAGTAYARFIEPEWLQLSEVRCPIKGLRRDVRLLHLSDLHASEDVANAFIQQAIALGLSTKPDLICVTGDFITGKDGFDEHWLTNTLGRLSATAPTFGVLGNHDGGDWAAGADGFPDSSTMRRILERSGIQLLANRHAIQDLAAAPVQLAGVGDLWSGDVDAESAFRTIDPTLPTILLAHNPDSKTLTGSQPWDLMLSGHTHGGQVVVPGLGLSPAPVRDKRYVAGLKPWRDRWIHVSRGVGNVRGVRFNCRPEVTVLHLTGK